MLTLKVKFDDVQKGIILSLTSGSEVGTYKYSAVDPLGNTFKAEGTPDLTLAVPGEQSTTLEAYPVDADGVTLKGVYIVTTRYIPTVGSEVVTAHNINYAPPDNDEVNSGAVTMTLNCTNSEIKVTDITDYTDKVRTSRLITLVVPPVLDSAGLQVTSSLATLTYAATYENAEYQAILESVIEVTQTLTITESYVHIYKIRAYKSEKLHCGVGYADIIDAAKGQLDIMYKRACNVGGLSSLGKDRDKYDALVSQMSVFSAMRSAGSEDVVSAIDEIRDIVGGVVVENDQPRLISGSSAASTAWQSVAEGSLVNSTFSEPIVEGTPTDYTFQYRKVSGRLDVRARLDVTSSTSIVKLLENYFSGEYAPQGTINSQFGTNYIAVRLSTGELDVPDAEGIDMSARLVDDSGNGSYDLEIKGNAPNTTPFSILIEGSFFID